ncbi:MAG: HAD family hydrolase [Promethearchaeota archaeon]
MSRKTTGIFFDFGTTLFDYYPSNSIVWSRIAKRLGFEISPDDPRIREGMRRQDVGFVRLGIPESKLTREDIHNLNCQVLSVMGIDGDITGIIEIIDEEFDRIFLTGEGFQMFPDSKETLERIHSMGIPIGMISNCPTRFCEPRRRIMKEHGIFDFFGAIILSGEVGLRKPGKKIFEIALKELGIAEAKNAMHVGDSVMMDVQGAQNAGLVPVLFDARDLHSVDNVIKIRKLPEIFQYLK